MVLEERISVLREKMEHSGEIAAEEAQRMEQMREMCDKAAEMICARYGDLVRLLAEDTREENGTSGDRKQQFLAYTAEQEKLLRERFLTEERWPHLAGLQMVNIRKQLWDRRFELKTLENKMVYGTKPQIRKWTKQAEEVKHQCEALGQAILALESWEGLFRIFMDDMQIRRRSGMDEQFYQLESQDMRRKMESCRSFTETIQPLVWEPVQEELQRVRGELESRLGSLSRKLPEEKKPYNECMTELHKEIYRYALACLFLEDHRYRHQQAEQERELNRSTAERLEREWECEKERIERMRMDDMR